MRIIILFALSFIFGCSHTGPIRLYPGETLDSKQEAILVLPEALDLLKINNENIPASTFAFRTSQSELRLAPGPNRLTIQYRTLWDVSSDQHQIVESGPIEFDVNLKGNHTYQFNWQTPASLENAIEFSNNPKIHIVGDQQSWLGNHQAKQSDLILIADPSTHSNKSENNIALDKLQYWWQRASLDEREAFLKSIKAAD
ncbi:DUF2057 domain-containing protein [Bermanella marisrubri]|uniref:DUF2057 domain-containing protein n=1 Tax=Bermanella marisrubri TaxID=207949 RepID=Q1N0B5_9GAMM|nr:DUF2057 family protein [Bermanella marisrubri]EAT11602.1 hypothetical protein RED65_07934 [Oceanobacter sp. RED65] [Bermanella marisrubri]QIZ83353.1 DUF2057 domain-containing protein [Bermanella marisrubri]